MEPGIVMRRYDCRKPCPEACTDPTRGSPHLMWLTWQQSHMVKNRLKSTWCLVRSSPEVILGTFYRYMKAEGAHFEEFFLL